MHAGQTVASLAATAVNLPAGTTITDGAGTSASLSLSGIVQSGPQIDTAAPSVASVACLPGSGVEDPGSTLTITLNMSELVTVAGGMPTLALNDGGTATYATGSGTNALVFQYTVASTDKSVLALAIEGVDLPTGVTITDGAGNAADLTGARVSFTGLSVDQHVTVAQYLANRTAFDATGSISIFDTAASVSTSIDALNSDPQVTAITLTDAGTPTLSLTVAQTLDDTHALTTITNAPYAVSVTDSAAAVSANLNALNADAQITSIHLTGTPMLSLSLRDAMSDGLALAEIATSYTITNYDFATNIQALTPAQIATLHQVQVTQITATNSGVVLTAAQALALENQRISLSVPSGSLATVSDTAANLEAMSPSQISSLGTLGVSGLRATDNNVTFNVTQVSAILGADLNVSAAGSHSVKELFLNGSSVNSSKNASGSETITLTGNGFAVDTSSSTINVSAAKETIPIIVGAGKAITASGTASDTFTFHAGFGNETINSFALLGANHDTLQFSESEFTYLTPAMSQAQDLAAILTHATTSGGATTLYDSTNDKVTLSSIGVAALAANAADFKFV